MFTKTKNNILLLVIYCRFFIYNLSNCHLQGVSFWAIFVLVFRGVPKRAVEVYCPEVAVKK
jgi:hypothetical protein